MVIIRIKLLETHLERMRARAHRELERHVDDAVRRPPIIPTPGVRQGAGVGLRHEVLRLCRPAVDLNGQPERPVVPQAVEGWRHLHGDGDGPALSVEEVEVILAADTDAMR